MADAKQPCLVEIIIRGPGHSGRSALARLIRAGILDQAGLFVLPNDQADIYAGCTHGEGEAAILRRLWPHIRIRTEDLP